MKVTLTFHVEDQTTHGWWRTAIEAILSYAGIRSWNWSYDR